MRNYVNENIHHSGKNGGYYTCIPVYVGHCGESNEGALYYRHRSNYLIGSNTDLVNYYAGLDEDDIESTVRLILIVQELMSLNRSRESEKRLLKK